MIVLLQRRTAAATATRCNRDDDRRKDSPLCLPHVWQQSPGRGVPYRKRNNALASSDCTVLAGTTNVAMTGRHPTTIDTKHACNEATTAIAAPVFPAVAAGLAAPFPVAHADVAVSLLWLLFETMVDACENMRLRVAFLLRSLTVGAVLCCFRKKYVQTGVNPTGQRHTHACNPVAKKKKQGTWRRQTHPPTEHPSHHDLPSNTFDRLLFEVQSKKRSWEISLISSKISITTCRPKLTTDNNETRSCGIPMQSCTVCSWIWNTGTSTTCLPVDCATSTFSFMTRGGTQHGVVGWTTPTPRVLMRSDSLSCAGSSWWFDAAIGPLLRLPK